MTWQGFVPIVFLAISNVFMTFAWYGQLKFPDRPLWIVVLVSWGIAFVEYCFAVPANRIGYTVYSAAELKTMQEIITLLVADIPKAQSGFRLTFSAAPFPGHKLVVTRGKAESGGFWYNVQNSDQTGWLCPALFKFFPKAPEKLYVRADPLNHDNGS